MGRLATNRTAGLLLAAMTVLLGVVACYLAVGLGHEALESFTLKWLYNGLIVAAGLVTMARAAGAGRERLPWLLLGLSFVLWGVGNTYWTLVLLERETLPFPSASDAFWLAFYPPAYVGLLLLLRSRVAEFRASLWLDGVVAALALAAVGSAVVFDPVLEATGGEQPAAVATNLSYPLADLLLLGLVVATLAASGWRPGRAWGLIAAGLTVFAVSDSVYLYQTAAGSYVAGTAVDFGWIAASVLIAWAAWQPSAPITRALRDGLWVVAPPILFALVCLALLVYDHFARINLLALVLATAALLAVLGRLAMTFGENVRMIVSSRREARTDALTGLGNRRRLHDDLSRAPGGTARRRLILFDLNGFKQYNDTFGHPAGDALLARLAHSLERAVSGHGRAYRMGGDEFCVLVDERSPELVAEAAAALAEQGVGFSIDAAYGAVVLPDEADSFADALRLADQRLYTHKHGLRGSAAEQSRSVLIQVLAERHPDLGVHVMGVADLAERVARQLGLEGADLGDIRAAAALHDIGKMGVPDAILDKPGPLDADEWEFVRRHTLIGERIVRAAPALTGAAKLVRSSHERLDGRGYPDGLAGDEIPLGARIICVCDAYDAMTTERPYSRRLESEAALAELGRCAGTQFDPRVVAAFARTVRGTPPLRLAS